MDVLQRKIEEELAGQDFRLSDSVCGVIHVLLAFQTKNAYSVKGRVQLLPWCFLIS